MNKKVINQLVIASYTKEQLDNKKVQRIAKILSRADLKKYIRGLKLTEKANTISLVLPDMKFYNRSLLGYTKKNITVLEDTSLLMGVKIIDNDTVYDMTLKNNLQAFIQSL